MLQDLAKGNSRYKSEPFLALVEKDNQILFVMVMTPPHGVVVYGEGPRLEEVIHFAVSELSSSGIHIPGVIGPKEIAAVFAKAWSKEKNVTPIVKMNQRIYKLEKVNEVPKSPGQLRVADENDRSLIAQWVHEFSKVTNEPLTKDESQSRAEFFVDEGTIYCWQIGEKIVSMVNKARPTKNGITVNYVYTPPEHQRKGYATSCVAAFSQLQLGEGYKYCFLYTDLANLTSNSIYIKIGYRPVCDSILYHFNNSN